MTSEIKRLSVSKRGADPVVPVVNENSSYWEDKSPTEKCVNVLDDSGVHLEEDQTLMVDELRDAEEKKSKSSKKSSSKTSSKVSGKKNSSKKKKEKSAERKKEAEKTVDPITEMKTAADVPPAADGEEELCCICLESYTTDNPKFSGQCQHHFHLPCLMNWKMRNNTCPMCCANSLRGVDGEANGPPPPTEDDARDEEMARQLQSEFAAQLQEERRQRAEQRAGEDGSRPNEKHQVKGKKPQLHQKSSNNCTIM